VQQIQTAADAKMDAAKYFQEKGTLKGWKGKMFTLEDFRSMKFDDGKPGKPKSAPTKPASVEQGLWDVMTPEERAAFND
jgi:hypothetical protein